MNSEIATFHFQEPVFFFSFLLVTKKKDSRDFSCCFVSKKEAFSLFFAYFSLDDRCECSQKTFPLFSFYFFLFLRYFNDGFYRTGYDTIRFAASEVNGWHLRIFYFKIKEKSSFFLFDKTLTNP